VGVAGVVEVRVGQQISEFTSGTALVTAAQKQIKKDLGISTVSALGDKVIFCLPPGTGGWIASAGIGHWRAQFNDEYCLSLTGTSTEQRLALRRLPDILHASGLFVLIGLRYQDMYVHIMSFC
jgi:hypothetical protein